MNDMDASTKRESDTVLYGILRIGHLIDERLNDALAPLGLSLPTLSVLQNLVHEGEPIPLGALSERLGCVKSNITQLVDRLEADKLVRRVRDPQDRRSVLAEITEEGRRRYQVGRQVLDDAERDILSGLSVRDRKQLASLVDRFGEGQDQR